MFDILVDRPKAETIARTAARECEHIIQNWDSFESFVLASITLDWNTRRVASRGGWYASGPGINIAMSAACTLRTSPYRLYEYKSFDLDPQIGGFFARDPGLAVELHVCHEMAHAAQYYAHVCLGRLKDRPHGQSFKQPYRLLRQSYLNPRIPKNQLQLKQEYETVLAKILTGKL